MLGLLTIFVCLSASSSYAMVSLLVEATKTVLAQGETNVLFVTLTKTANFTATIPTVITVTVPGSMTVGTTNAAAGTTYAAGTWTIPQTVLNTQGLNNPLTLTIQVTQTTGQGQIFEPSAIITSGNVGTGQTSSIEILVGCPFLTWGTAAGQVRVNGGDEVNLNNANLTYNQDFAPTVNAVFDGYRKNTPTNGTPQYTARFQNANIPNLGQVLQFTNAIPQSNPSGNAPVTMIGLNGDIDPSKVSPDPANYLEGKFTFDAGLYPDGLNGISFFIYDIDANPTNGWQDGVIVFGTDSMGNMVTPVTQQSSITTVYNVKSTPYSVSVGGKCSGTATGTACLVNYTNDNPRGRVTYLFPDRVRSITIRYFRNSQINSSHLIYLSSLYRGCGTDLALSLDLSLDPVISCSQCFAYELTAANLGPNAVGLAQVSGVMPAGVNFVSATPSQGSFDPLTNKWLVGSLTVNQEETLTMNVCADQNAALTTLEYNVELLGDGEEIDPGNNIVDLDVAINYIVVQNDAVATPYQVPVNIQWDANDFSVGGTLDYGTFQVLTVTDGTVAPVSPGIIQFTPDNGFTGNAYITYEVSDSNGCTGSATITVVVNSQVLPPIALPNFALTDPITPVIIPVLDNDIPGTATLVPGSVSVVLPPANGVAIPNPDGTITYTPNQGFCGVDLFVYNVCNSNLLCAQAYVTVNVVCPPKAMNDSATTPINTAVELDVIANDIPTNAPIDPTSVTIVVPPSNGSVVVDPVTGIVTYTPVAFFTGTDSFVYRVCGTDGLCSQATGFITVTPLYVPCPSDITTDGCRDKCFDRVVECLCNEVSFNHFTPTSGVWTQVGDHVSVHASYQTFNFLRYDTPIDQSHEILEVKLTFSTDQALTQFVSAGVATNWNGVDPVVGASVVYITFNNTAGFPTNARLSIGTHNDGEVSFPLASIVLGQTYTLRIVKNFQQTAAYLDGVFIGYVPSTGTVPGNYIGLWAFGASAEFKDLTSCSYPTPLGLFNENLE